LFARNIAQLNMVLIGTHISQPIFLECQIRLLKGLIKELLAYEKSLKDKQAPVKRGSPRSYTKQIPAEYQSTILNIKRIILFNIGKPIVEINEDN